MPAQMIEIIAWWGAILSTIVFIWDVIKWKLVGPKLRLSVSSNMQSINIPEYEGKTLITVEIVNYGDRPTTLTTLGFFHYPGLWSRLRCRAKNNFIIPNPNLSYPLPRELRPGTKWNGFVFQTESLEGMARNGYLTCFVLHTHRKRPAKKRVRIK